MESIKRPLFISLSRCAANSLHGCIRTTSCHVQELRNPSIRFRAVQSAVYPKNAKQICQWFIYIALATIGTNIKGHRRLFHNSTNHRWQKGWNWGNLQPGRDRMMYRRHSSYTKISKLNGMEGNHQAALGNKQTNKPIDKSTFPQFFLIRHLNKTTNTTIWHSQIYIF